MHRVCLSLHSMRYVINGELFGKNLKMNMREENAHWEKVVE